MGMGGGGGEKRRTGGWNRRSGAREEEAEKGRMGGWVARDAKGERARVALVGKDEGKGVGKATHFNLHRTQNISMVRFALVHVGTEAGLYFLLDGNKPLLLYMFHDLIILKFLVNTYPIVVYLKSHL